MKNNNQPQIDHAYLIMAPDYRESSLGVQVIHRLCHMINEQGGRAFLVGCKVNPEWNTPVLSQSEYISQIENKIFIAVYPEVVTGNPLNAPVCVRYMLNREGVITGNQIKAGPDDIYFWFREEFADKDKTADYLRIELQDLDFFCDDNLTKDITLLYYNRVPKELIDFTEFPEDIHVLNMENPLSLHELGNLLKRAKKIYTYEASGTYILANLCGCPTVAKYMPGFEHMGIQRATVDDYGGGVAWDDTEEQLALARESLPKVRERYILQQAKMQEQFEHFMSVTQIAAEKKHFELNKRNINTWLSNRNQDSKISLVLKTPKIKDKMLFLIDASGFSENEIKSTINSLAYDLACVDHIHIAIKGYKGFILSSGNVTILNDSDCELSIGWLLSAYDCSWLMLIREPVIFHQSALRRIIKSSDEYREAYFIYADELACRKNSLPENNFRAGLNIDLLVSQPGIYAKNWLINVLPSDTSILSKRINEYSDIESIFIKLGSNVTVNYFYLPEPLLTVLKTNYRIPDRDYSFIHSYIERKGYTSSKLEVNEFGVVRVDYNHNIIPMVGIFIVDGEWNSILERCIKTIMEVSSYTNYHITVGLMAADETGFSSSDCLPLEIVSLPRGTKKTVAINELVNNSLCDIIVLIDPSAVIVQGDWLQNLINHAMRKEVACVSGKLIDFSQRIILTGITSGFSESVTLCGKNKHIKDKEHGYFSASDRNYSYLSALSLMFKRSVWKELQGLNPQMSLHLEADIDFCIRAAEKNYAMVSTPYSVIAFDEEHLPDVFIRKDIAIEKGRRLLSIWPQQISSDVFSNYNVDESGQINWDLERLNSLNSIDTSDFIFAIEYVKEHYHLFSMQELYLQTNATRTIILPEWNTPALIRAKPKQLLLTHNSTFKKVVSENKALLEGVYVQSLIYPDVISEKEISKKEFVFYEELVVFSERFADYLSVYHKNINFVPAAINKNFWSTETKVLDFNHDKIRVGLLTYGATVKDLQLITDLILEFRSHVDWVVIGNCPKFWLPNVYETRHYRGEKNLPAQLQELQMDVVLIPQAKSFTSKYCSPLQVLQLASLGIPVIRSKLDNVSDKFTFEFVKNTTLNWRKMLLDIVCNKEEVLRKRKELLGKVHEIPYFDTKCDDLNVKLFSRNK